jgi:hypothetical protein
MAMLLLQMFLSQCQKFLMLMVLLKVTLWCNPMFMVMTTVWNEMFNVEFPKHR